MKAVKAYTFCHPDTDALQSSQPLALPFCPRRQWSSERWLTTGRLPRHEASASNLQPQTFHFWSFQEKSNQKSHHHFQTAERCLSSSFFYMRPRETSHAVTWELDDMKNFITRSSGLATHDFWRHTFGKWFHNVIEPWYKTSHHPSRNWRRIYVRTRK